MTVVEQTSDAHRDLRLALHTATALQATIRHADTKAQILLGLQGGLAALALPQAPALGRLGGGALTVVASAAAAALVSALAVSGWHALATILPRLDAPSGNRFAFPDAPPATVDLGDQRDEAWAVTAALAGTALTKHRRVRRAIAALVVALAGAGVLLAVAATMDINV